MYGLTRATTTLLAAGVAGLLIWIATRINDHSTGGYWAVYGLIVGAGLLMALSQLLGGWTKWGMPRMSASVFLFAFLPVLVVAGWVVIGHQPNPNWFRKHILAWSGDIGIRGLVNDLMPYASVLAFGIGLVFGYSFDTTGPRKRAGIIESDRDVVSPADRRTSDEPLTADRGTAETPSRFARLGRRGRAPVGSDGRPVDDRDPVETTDRS